MVSNLVAHCVLNEHSGIARLHAATLGALSTLRTCDSSTSYKWPTEDCLTLIAAIGLVKVSVRLPVANSPRSPTTDGCPSCVAAHPANLSSLPDLFRRRGRACDECLACIKLRKFGGDGTTVLLVLKLGNAPVCFTQDERQRNSSPIAPGDRLAQASIHVAFGRVDAVDSPSKGSGSQHASCNTNTIILARARSSKLWYLIGRLRNQVLMIAFDVGVFSPHGARTVAEALGQLKPSPLLSIVQDRGCNST